MNSEKNIRVRRWRVWNQEPSAFQLSSSSLCSWQQLPRSSGATVSLEGGERLLFLSCDQASDLINHKFLKCLSFGAEQLFLLRKNCVRPAGHRRITEEKIQPGREQALTFHTSSPEAALAPVGFSGHLPERSLLPGFGCSPSQVALPDKPTDWFLPFWRISSSIFWTDFSSIWVPPTKAIKC